MSSSDRYQSVNAGIPEMVELLPCFEATFRRQRVNQPQSQKRHGKVGLDFSVRNSVVF
jgi:hypothetical protein